MDIAFLIDSSSSVTEKNFKKALDFVRAVVKPLEFASGKTRVSVVTFSGEAVARFYLDTYETRKDILRALKYISYDPGKLPQVIAKSLWLLKLNLIFA